MMVLGPTMIMLVFFAAFILFIKFLTIDLKEVRVIREEQLYNRDLENRNVESQKDLVVRDNRGPVVRDYRSQPANTDRTAEEEGLDRDSGIV